MLVSLPANPVAELYYFVNGSSPFRLSLPWHIWGGGVYATKYSYDPVRFPSGYLGTVSVPLYGQSVVIRSFRLLGAVEGQIGAQEGAMVTARLFQRTGNLSSSIATIMVDRRAVPNNTLGSISIDITQSAGGFVASASDHHLGIDLRGFGQGIATITGFVIDMGP